MEKLLLTIIVILIVTVFILTIKIVLIHRSAMEITEAIRERLESDTNTLIDLSTRDPYMRRLASELNTQLRLLRTEQHRFMQGNQEIKNAITNISHDLRTPLTAISAYLELLEREEQSETIHRYLEQISNRTCALKNLTEELFRYSIVTGVQELKRENLDLKRALEESLLSFYELMKEKNIQPEISMPEEAVWRELDAAAVNRIFSNIVNNALKYSEGDLSVQMEDTGEIVFTNTASHLNPVIAGKLFDRFYTVEAGRNSTGLGLAIAKQLTQQMNGQIWAEYTDNRLQIKLKF